MNSIGDMVKHHLLGLIKIVLIQIVFFAMYVFFGVPILFYIICNPWPSCICVSFTILDPLLGFIPTVMAVETLKGFHCHPDTYRWCCIFNYLLCAHDTQYDGV